MANETQTRFAEYDASSGPLPALCLRLLDEQKKSWPRLTEGYDSLDRLQTRIVHCQHFDALLQFNPGRLVSTAANVDAVSIKSRPCFLCKENLPAEQRGILVNGEFLVLCNPAPIFRIHYTISHLEHRPQSLEGSMSQFLNLCRQLAPEFSLFYNGPKCGASAPDHLHFQAAPAGAIPIEHDAGRAERRVSAWKGRVSISTLKDLGREVLVMEGEDPVVLEQETAKLLQSMRSVFSVDDEPMVNIIASFIGDRWRLIVFPRSAHRPLSFFGKGEAKITVSPAAVDMGGLVITPVERDFYRLDAPAIESIYAEVSVRRKMMEDILDRYHDLR